MTRKQKRMLWREFEPLITQSADRRRNQLATALDTIVPHKSTPVAHENKINQ